MPRQARIDAPGALHHIICRGIERRNIFRGKKDYGDFVARLAAIVSETKTPCYAWALIPNHFHLLLKTGTVPIATVMRRLLTGYAVSFNHRHHRHGHLFQNRYKSILCQEDTYLLELVRYIHLNPLRAKLVAGYEKLSGFAWSGHGTLAGTQANDWQDTSAVLRMFDEDPGKARLRYLEYVHEGIGQGRRSDLTGGGLVRSVGGWEAVRGLRKTQNFYKSDERILGDSDFVDDILKQAEEHYHRRQALRSQGITLKHLLDVAARITEVPSQEILKPGKDRQRVRARSLLCYWAVRELGMTMTEMSRSSGLSVPAISMAVQRGEKFTHEMKSLLPELLNLKT